MLINCNNNDTKHVNFVSYTGEWPNLCSGVLTLEIDGKEITFGYGFNSKDKPTYRPFWSSGGGLMPNYEGAWQGEWQIARRDVYAIGFSDDEIKWLGYDWILEEEN